MKKLFVVLLLCVALLMTLFTFGATAVGNPSGVAYKGASTWAIPELDKAAAYGLITDRIKDNMSGNITREEFAEVIVKFYELYTGKKAQSGNVSFTDTSNPEILKAANLGLVQGGEGNKYAPKQLITRDQMATILFRALKVINPGGDYSSSDAAKFTDDNLIKIWAREGVYYCSHVGIIKGVQDKKTGKSAFEPGGNSSREAAVIVCTRAYELFAQVSTQANMKDDNYQSELAADTLDISNSSANDWNGGLIINSSEFKKDECIISEIDGESYIYLPYERFKYVFKMPYSGNHRYPDVNMKDGKVTVAWKNKQGEINLEVIMIVDSSVAYLNGQQGDITVGPYYVGDTLYVPINIFIELFSMKTEMFQGRLCFQYEDDFPQEILVGSWGYSNVSIFTGYKDMVTGVISIPSFDFTYTFNADGTFRAGAAGSGAYSLPTIVFQTGKYKLVGNTIICYDVYETLYKGKPLLKIYEKKHMADRLGLNFIDNYNAEEDKIEFDLSWYNRLKSE